MAIKSLLDEGKSQRLGGVVQIDCWGISNPKTAMSYTHVSRKDVLCTKRPFDEL